MTVSEVARADVAARFGEALEHQRYQLADMRRDVGGDVDGRTLFGLSINVMPFDYGFSFAGHRATAHNLSLGPVEDLSISVYDRADGGRFGSTSMSTRRCIRRPISTVYRQRFLRLLTAMADADRPIGNLDILDRAERDTILRRVERHGAADAAGDGARTVRRAGRAHAGRRRGDLRGPHADLRGARRPRQPPGASSAKPRRRARDRGGAVRRALAGDADRPARHPQGRRRLSAARRRLSARAAGVHAGRCRRRRCW